MSDLRIELDCYPFLKFCVKVQWKSKKSEKEACTSTCIFIIFCHIYFNIESEFRQFIVSSIVDHVAEW